MREIKFRAWDKYTQRMNSTLSLGVWKLDPNGVMVNWGNHEDRESYILMQYTGLKDKNGKDIYEGDVVQYGSNWTRVVEFKEIEDCYLGDKPALGYDIALEAGEIIGNIYENPDLASK